MTTPNLEQNNPIIDKDDPNINSTESTGRKIEKPKVLDVMFDSYKKGITNDKDVNANDELKKILEMLKLTKTQLQKDEEPEKRGIFRNIVQEKIKLIDQEISKTLNNIFHKPKFQELEATWRGLHYLVSRTKTNELLILRILDISKEELIDNNKDFKKCTLYDKLYKYYGKSGEYPYSLLIGDYYFTQKNKDLKRLEMISRIAAAVHSPFISAASPQLLDETWNDFSNIQHTKDLPGKLSKVVKWKMFRESEDSRYVSLVLPRFLLRAPYGEENRSEGLNFEEDVEAKNYSNFLWGNTVFALAQRITNAFHKYHWCVAIRGIEGGGKIELPDYADYNPICSIETSLLENQEIALSNMGFIPLVFQANTDFASFWGGQTTQKPAEYSEKNATANAALSAKLPHILATSRISHFIKRIIRRKVGSGINEEELEKYLNEWLNTLVGKGAKYPLADGKVEVVPIKGRPGFYEAEIYIIPHFQLEGVAIKMKIVEEIPKKS